MAATWTALLASWANKAISIARMNAYLGSSGNMQWLYDQMTTLTDVAFSAGNFTASAGTWTVEEADQVTYAYNKCGVMCTMMIKLDYTSVSATPDYLYIHMPVTATRTVVAPFRLYDGDTERVGYAIVIAGSDIMSLRSPTGTFATSTNLTICQIVITFPVDM
jgi:hypothetical protein